MQLVVKRRRCYLIKINKYSRSLSLENIDWGRFLGASVGGNNWGPLLGARGGKYWGNNLGVPWGRFLAARAAYKVNLMAVFLFFYPCGYEIKAGALRSIIYLSKERAYAASSDANRLVYTQDSLRPTRLQSVR